MTERFSTAIKTDTIEEARTLFGIHDRNIRLIRNAFAVDILSREGEVRIEGERAAVERADEVLRVLLAAVRAGRALEPEDVEGLLQSKKKSGRHAVQGAMDTVQPKSPGQRQYMEKIGSHDITFATGPAGTGKTFLAVVEAVRALRAGAKQRIVLCRPAVEAGEKLGFLPGDIFAKVNPYLRPLYDALHSLLDYEDVKKYIEREIIEIVPLAYMRGRTLNRSFVILDEAQNTTRSQMLMFLTRMGEGSKIVVTGDVTQTDLPPETQSGLVHAKRLLAGVEGIAIHDLTTRDIVRHPLVWKIVDAYDGDKEG